jgi:SAM-dependent methyltransferase
MQQEPINSERPAFTPGAGYHWLTPMYHVGLAVLTRENYWRAALAAQIDSSPGDVIADVGCGTGSLLVSLGRSATDATLIGIDPDPNILDRARVKAKAAGIAVELLQGFAREANKCRWRRRRRGLELRMRRSSQAGRCILQITACNEHGLCVRCSAPQSRTSTAGKILHLKRVGSYQSSCAKRVLLTSPKRRWSLQLLARSLCIGQAAYISVPRRFPT